MLRLNSKEDEDVVQPSPRRAWWRRVRPPEFETRREARRKGFYALLGASAALGMMCGLALVYGVHLPQMDDLARYHPSTTTELLDVHGKVFGSFALERRIVVPYSELPPVLRQAIFSIEDKDFETNGGLNLVRMVSAAYHDIHSKEKTQGASTLTMQLARNLFLSPEKTYSRKLQEILLTLQIERQFTKQQIFTLYANQIYLGRGTYGFEAGSEFYFSKHARDLTLAQAALLAGLPKGPEEFSPVRHPDRALKRRNLVLSEMLADKKITAEEAARAKAEPLGLHIETPANSEAPYFVEEVRKQLEREYGVEETHGAGLRVYTTLDLDLQRVAKRAVMDGTANYERRHGWKGHLVNVLDAGESLDEYKHPDWTEPLAEGEYFHALVTDVSAEKLTAKVGTQTVTMTQPDWAWTTRTKATDLARVGDIVYVKIVALSNGASSQPRVNLQEDSGAQASMMAVDNSDGEVIAMVGGRDFNLSQFNRATQAQRQVGSSFKPYDYTTAIEGGMKPTDIVLDEPTTFATPNGPYTPHNYEPDYKGPMTLIQAFEESRNIPALRLASKFGIKKVIETAQRFGITSNLPEFLPVAIGAADITLAEQVGAYSVFPNDGIRIAPHYIRKIVEADGTPVEEPTPQVREVISVDVARQMMILLQAVVQHGTGAAAASMKHALGGKTGTTNGYTDAWFVGFSPSVTCGTWIGFDNRETLGEKETGARAALPMWMDFMKAVVADKPNEEFSKPDAPKKALAVPLTSNAPDNATPAKPASEDDSDMPDDAPAPAAPPAAPPVTNAVPDDEGNSTKSAPTASKPAPASGAKSAPPVTPQLP